MEITKRHIEFYDRRKLREACRALEADPLRAKLGERFLKGSRYRSAMFPRELPKLDKGPSVHLLIPQVEEPERLRRSRKERNRWVNRTATSKDRHLMGNLQRFVKGKMRRGESLAEALVHYTRGRGGGSRDYAKYARRWCRKLGIEYPYEEWTETPA